MIEQLEAIMSSLHPQHLARHHSVRAAATPSPIEPLEPRRLLAAAPAFAYGISVGDVDDPTFVSAAQIATKADAQGNAYVLRSWKTDFILSKYNSKGKQLWLRKLRNVTSQFPVGADFRANNPLAVDADGSVFLTASFTGKVDFDPGPGKAVLTSAGETDGFVLKLDSNGKYLWARRFGSKRIDSGERIAVRDGVIYVSGTLDGATGGPDSITPHTNGSRKDPFIARLSDDGRVLWATRPQRLGGGVCNLSDIDVDAKGNLYVIGDHAGVFDFDPSARTRTLAADTRTSFLWKVKPNGTLGFATKAATGRFRTLAVDSSGGVYAAGLFTGEIVFGDARNQVRLTSAPPDPQMEAEPSSDLSVARFDATGRLQWARSWGNTFDEAACDVAIDPAGGVYVAGTGTLVLRTYATGTVIQRWSRTGQLLWTSDFADAQVQDSRGSYSIATAPGNVVYALGWFGGNTDINPTTGVLRVQDSPSGTGPLFLLRLRFSKP